MRQTILLYVLFVSIIAAGIYFMQRGNYYTYIGRSIEALDGKLASAFFAPSVNVNELHARFAQASVKKTQPKIRILIMPGHEPGAGGTEYRGIAERDLAVDLAIALGQDLVKDEHFEVILARDKNDWNPVIKDFFKTRWDEIKKFRTTQKAQMAMLEGQGKIQRITDGVSHNNAPEDMAIRLFGINMWANENKMDLVIHLHFNDYSRRNLRRAGEFTGFTIYVPERQYSNATATRAIATDVYERLSDLFPVSDMPKEDVGIVEDQDLIAIGQSNSVDAASMLIEYGYIYEPQFQNAEIRKLILKDMAMHTYLGIEDFFGGTPKDAEWGTALLPHTWTKNITKSDEYDPEVLHLQVALSVDDLYPVAGTSKNECPLTGMIGPCTQKSLAKFQDKYGITGEKGRVGNKTRAKLNELFGEPELTKME